MADNSALFAFPEQWLDAQKKMFEFWQSSIGLQGKKDEKATASASIFEASMKPAQDILNKWVGLSGDMFGKNFKPFSATYPQELIGKMLGSANAYQNLTRFWEDLQANIVGKESDPIKFANKWNDEYLRMVSNNFIGYLPEQMQIFFKDPLDVYKMFSGSSQNFFAPWQENARTMQSLISKSMGGDQTAFIEFSRLWNDNFNSSYGKFLSLPQFSLNRENMQKFNQSLSTWISYINILSEFVATLMKANKETLEEIVGEYQEMATNGSNPKTFKEFYEYWWRKNEKAYMALFSTDEFCRLIAKTLDAGVSFKRDFDDLLEEQLKFLPYPSRNDMDSVYQTISELKREVRTLKKEVEMIKGAVKSAKQEM